MPPDGDFDALHAHVKIDAHEKVCAERMSHINVSIGSIHERLNSLSNRMWAAAIGIATLAALAAAGLLIVVLTRGLK